MIPVVSVRVCGRFLPALVGLWVEQTVVSVDGVTQVTSVVLLACGHKVSLNQPEGTVNVTFPACPTTNCAHCFQLLQVH